MLFKTLSAAVYGVDANVVEVEVDVSGIKQSEDHFVIATHGNGPLISPEAPASPGEVVVLYATGLGPTSPLTPPNKVPTAAAKLTLERA